jgi:imidazolonepropionase-like amidohydrolase
LLNLIFAKIPKKFFVPANIFSPDCVYSSKRMRRGKICDCTLIQPAQQKGKFLGLRKEEVRMRNIDFFLLSILVFLMICPFAGFSSQSEDSFALKGATVYTVSGPKILNATILVENGKISAVGEAVKIPDGVKVLDVKGRVIIPGLIDIHSHLGVSEDGNEFPEPIGPENRALDALNLESPDWAEAVKGGVVTLVTGPGAAERISGQSITIKTYGANLEKRILKEAGEVKMAVYGRNLSHIQAIRSSLIKAREYMDTWARYESGDKKEPPPKRDLANEALARVLRGEHRIRVHIYYANDMLSFLKLKDEFGFRLTFEHSTEAFKIADEIARRNVGCVCGPLVTREAISDDLMQGILILHKAGVKIAFHTDYPVSQQKWLRLCAMLSIRYGLPEDAALKAITINPAELAMVSNRVGSIEKGKDADLVVLNGPWYELRSRVDMVFVDGALAYDRSKSEKSF